MPAESTEQRKLAAIMFTDMVGYSALAQRNEALALELLEEHRRLLRPIFHQFNGREIETAGDAFLMEYEARGRGQLRSWSSSAGGLSARRSGGVCNITRPLSLRQTVLHASPRWQ